MHDTEHDLIPIEEAAAKYGCDLKRLRGAIWRGCTKDNRISDPIGSLDAGLVYGWSVERWAKRQGVAS